MEPGALLNDAYKEFEVGNSSTAQLHETAREQLEIILFSQGDESHKADEYIRYIKDKLPDAVSQCIKAAGEEFSPDIQQSLLKVQFFTFQFFNFITTLYRSSRLISVKGFLVQMYLQMW